jgi:hypothetical protein
LQKHFSEDIFTVYPNPAGDHIQIKGNYPNTILSIIDLSGRVILSERLKDKQENIDISRLSSGSYFYRVETVDQCVIGKLVITK